ncbi:hypothetical protein [uncultured Nevskia sp.]|uniref:hypothetical protein n=1 Tax=uncultured Nevskia sp. TaxID=228950 RepID=UPI0025E9B38D|nr:hypothetical protein [uncultured Nevskia sp.]
MKKTLFAAATLAAVMSIPAQAGGPIVQNTLLVVKAVLAEPGVSLSNIVKALPDIANDTVAGVANVGNALPPALLRTSPQQRTTQTIIVPLPGPAFLNADLVNIQGEVGVKVTMASPLTITLTTGQ